MKQLFYLTLVLLFFAGCAKKSNEINYSKDVIFKQMDTLCFKPGTYWVYGLRNSLAVDCVYVKTVKRSVYNVDYIGNQGVLRDFYEMTLGNSANETYVYWIESSRMVFNPKTHIPWAIGPFLYSANPADDWKFTDNKAFDSIVSDSLVYYHVQRCRDSVTSTSYYTSRDLGVVMRVTAAIPDTQTWHLIRWNLIR